MSDPEKVISGLTNCLHYKGTCLGCSYEHDGPNCQNDVLDDAIAMLKEQEPKQIISIADSIEGMEVGYCPSCNRTIVNKKNDETKFCKFCGQAVKWK